MAKSVIYDPKSDEISSPPIASMSEAVSLIADALNMKTVSETGIPLTEVYIEENDRFRIFQAPEGKRVWVASPAPVIRKSGTVVSGYKVVGGGIIFDSNQTDGDGLTVDCTYIVNDAENKVTPDQFAAKADKSTLIPATLTAAGWTGTAPYTQTVSVEGILADDTPIADVVLSDTAATAQAQLEAWGMVGRIKIAAGSITAICYEDKPTVDLTIQFKVVG